MKLLTTSGIHDHIDLARLVHVELASIDEILDLDTDALSLGKVLLQVFVSLFKFLDLLEPSSKLSTGVALELLRLLDLLLGPSSLGRGLHEVRRVTLGDYR